MVCSHSWAQTAGEVSVSVPVPPGTRGAACAVDISVKRLRVGLKGQPPLLEGELDGVVRPEESSWSLVDGQAIELSLQKADDRWWDGLLQQPGSPRA